MASSSRGVLLLTAAALVLALSACAAPASAPRVVPTPQPTATATAIAAPTPTPADPTQALEAYAAAERATLPTLLKQNPGYSKASVTVKRPHTIIYSYTYAQTVDPATAKAYFDGIVPTFTKSVKTAVFPAMKLRGVTGVVVVRYAYYNKDGSLLWKKDFRSPKL